MLSTMNTANLSGAFCCQNFQDGFSISNRSESSKTEGHFYGQKGYPIDKRAILWTKETSPRQNVDAFPASPEKLVSPDSP